MKRLFVLAVSVLVAALAAAPAQAVPSLGVATNVAYVGSTGQTGLEPYQDFFVNTFIPGTDADHGFVVGASGSNLIVFTNWVNTPIYLLWTNNVEAANDPLINGVAGTNFGRVGQFDGYTPANYYGILLGPVVTSGPGAWAALPSDIFTPDGNRGAASGGGTSDPNFYALAVQLTYNGAIDPGSYFFAIADTNGGGPSGNGRLSLNYDPFSPKTTSATGASVVPEPGTLVLLGSGLIGLAGWARKRNLR